MNYSEDLVKNHTILSNSPLNIGHEDTSLDRVSYSEDQPIWKKLDYLAYAKLSLSSLLIIGGLLGNISIILTVALKDAKKTVSNIYATNLAVADSMVCVFCVMPLAFSAVVEDAYLVSELKCKYTPFIQMTCLASSVFTLAALSYARFKAINCPLYVRLKKHNTVRSIMKIWATAIILALPLLVVKKQIYSETWWERKCTEEWPFEGVFENTPGKCTWNNPLHLVYYLQVTLLLFFLPFIVMATAYSRVLLKLWTEGFPGVQSAGSLNIYIETRNRWTKMILIMLMVFVLSWSSFHVMILRSAYECMTGILTTKCSDCQWFIYFTAYANSLYNPFFYIIFNKTFRENMCDVWQRGLLKKEHAEAVEGIEVFEENSPRRTNAFVTSLRKMGIIHLIKKSANQNSNQNKDSHVIERAPENI